LNPLIFESKTLFKNQKGLLCNLLCFQPISLLTHFSFSFIPTETGQSHLAHLGTSQPTRVVSLLRSQKPPPPLPGMPLHHALSFVVLLRSVEEETKHWVTTFISPIKTRPYRLPFHR
jgi:hypothetical protein